MSQVLVTKLEGGVARLELFDTDRFAFEHATDGTPEGLLVPGFIDLHIHGAFGFDLMSASHDELLQLCERLAAEGYEAFLPTTITASLRDIRGAISRLPDHPMIAGFHLEGPFISQEYPGAQPLDFISGIYSGSSDWDAIWDHPKLRLVTLAPELAGAYELIQRLSTRGVICSMGHTNATYDQALAATRAGLSHATHTYNAMRPLHHREPGALGAALSIDAITCELIYDRIHVAYPAAKILIEQKVHRGKAIAVSDSSAATGLRPGTALAMWGHDCLVGDGRVNLTSNGSLAGSAVSLRTVFQNLFQDFGAPVAQEMCCSAPRRELGIETVRVWNLIDANTGKLIKTYSAG